MIVIEYRLSCDSLRTVDAAMTGDRERVDDGSRLGGGIPGFVGGGIDCAGGGTRLGIATSRGRGGTIAVFGHGEGVLRSGLQSSAFKTSSRECYARVKRAGRLPGEMAEGEWKFRDVCQSRELESVRFEGPRPEAESQKVMVEG